MKIFLKSVLIFLLVLWLVPLSAHAENLDVFESGKTFPTDFLFKEGIPNLSGLEADEMESVLQQFIAAKKRVESPAQNNLIHLGIAYIYLSKNEFQKAQVILTEEINGEFILDDFKIHFLTLALSQMAEEKISEGDLDQAVVYLEEAFKQQMTLFINYPSSPFHENIPQHLVKIEKRLGDVYFQKQDYSSAWTRYNNALVRDYPDKGKNDLEIYLALARTYEAGNNLAEAADIYIYLLNHYSSQKAKNLALAFLKKHQKELEKSNGNAEQLTRLLHGMGDEAEEISKPVARKLQKWPNPGNDVIQKLYHALSMDDFEKILEYGERVLVEFPGDENTKGVFEHVNRAVLNHIATNSWSEEIDHLVSLYPVYYMSRLARMLWERGFPDPALVVYSKVLKQFPTEALACHKALFFMGRIEEDNHHYPEAIAYYEKLLEKYNWGYFTPAAQFKIPWLQRLQGNFGEAKTGFSKLLKYANSEYYRTLDNGFPEPDDFRPAALYWLAQTEGQSGNFESRGVFLKRLVEEFPMDFYTMVARLELNMNPLSFLEPQSNQKSVPRKWGLGEINRKRINRAEKLISIGFLEMGMKELFLVTRGEENQEFLYYVAQLFKKAGGFQKAIGLSWGISRNQHHDSISPPLAEILFPKPYLEKAVKESSQYHLDPYLVMALMRQESAFNKKVVSSARAIGLMQLLPSTATSVARSMGSKPPDQKDLKKPEVNIHLGVKYLHELLEEFQDNIIFALASYNAGPEKVKDWIEIRSMLTPLEFMESIPYKETRNYVKKVLRNYVIYKILYGEGGINDFQGVLTVRTN